MSRSIAFVRVVTVFGIVAFGVASVGCSAETVDDEPAVDGIEGESSDALFGLGVCDLVGVVAGVTTHVAVRATVAAGTCAGVAAVTGPGMSICLAPAAVAAGSAVAAVVAGVGAKLWCNGVATDVAPPAPPTPIRCSPCAMQPYMEYHRGHTHWPCMDPNRGHCHLWTVNQNPSTCQCYPQKVTTPEGTICGGEIGCPISTN